MHPDLLGSDKIDKKAWRNFGGSEYPIRSFGVIGRPGRETLAMRCKRDVKWVGGWRGLDPSSHLDFTSDMLDMAQSRDGLELVG